LSRPQAEVGSAEPVCMSRLGGRGGRGDGRWHRDQRRARCRCFSGWSETWRSSASS